MAAAETRSPGCDTVNCRAREIRTDSIRLVASRKLQSSIFGAVIRQERAVPNNGHQDHSLVPIGRLVAFDHRSGSFCFFKTGILACE